MLAYDVPFINEEFHADAVSPAALDTLLADGWRHFGTHFFRYSLGFYGTEIRAVIPLRIHLAGLTFSKSQRRILRRNADLNKVIGPVQITREAEDLFEVHKRRFSRSVPDSIFDFISADPATVPCPAMQVAVYAGERLAAVSYFDVGRSSVSGIYAMFHPEFAPRSLGIFTMLKEIEFATSGGRTHYYQGYCYEGESFYDYKKNFDSTEAFDWRGNWKEYRCESGNLTGPVL